MRAWPLFDSHRLPAIFPRTNCSRSVPVELRSVENPTRSPSQKNKPSTSQALNMDLKNKSLALPHSLIKEAHRCCVLPSSPPRCTPIHTSAQRQKHKQIPARPQRSKWGTHWSRLCVCTSQTLLFLMNSRLQGICECCLSHILLARPLVSGCLNEVAVIFCLCAFSVICHMITEAVLVCLSNANVFQFPPHKDRSSLIQKMSWDRPVTLRLCLPDAQRTLTDPHSSGHVQSFCLSAAHSDALRFTHAHGPTWERRRRARTQTEPTKLKNNIF